MGDTAKVGLRLGSPVVKIKPGANLGVLDSTRALGLTKGQTTVLGSTKVQTRVLGSTKDQTRAPGLTKDQAQDSAVEVQTQALARVQVQTTTHKAQMVAPTMVTQPLPHPVLMLSSAQVPSMETMTILHLLDVALGVVVVVVQLGVGVVDVVVGRKSKALEASNQEKVVMEERSAVRQRSFFKAARIK